MLYSVCSVSEQVVLVNKYIHFLRQTVYNFSKYFHLTMPNIRTLNEQLQAKAKIEVNEEPERISEDLQYIKVWLKKQPHLKARTDDQWLLAFLRGCKFSLEKAKQKLDNFYSCKTLIPEVYANRDPSLPELQRVFKLGVFLPLTNDDDPASPLYFLIRNSVYDPTIDTFETLYKYMFMIYDILLFENDNFVVSGFNVIIDMKNVTLAHYLIPAGILEKVMIMYQKNYPVRTKAINVIHASTISHICYNILVQFMAQKLQNRSNFFSEEEMSKFYKSVPLKCLPNEYGGTAGTLQELIDMWKKKIESYAHWFKDDEKYRTNEQLRQGKPKTKYDMFGVEGTFRKLNVD